MLCSQLFKNTKAFQAGSGLAWLRAGLRIAVHPRVSILTDCHFSLCLTQFADILTGFLVPKQIRNVCQAV